MNDWLDRFYTYAMLQDPPPIYAKWAAISALSSLVQRRQWFTYKGTKSYLPLYVILTGPPTAGKGLAMRPVQRLLTHPEFKDSQFIAADSITAAALADELNDAYSAIVTEEHRIEQHALTVLCTELGNFLPEYDRAMLNRLIKLWDGEGYEERRRGSGKLSLPNAHLNFLAGTTPSFLAETIPDIAWEGGFMSRSIIVYYGRESTNEFFEDAGWDNKELFNELVKDGRKIMDQVGRVRFDAGAVEEINKWIRSGCAPKQSHPKLSFYNGRRATNVLKLSCLSAISRLSQTVTGADVQRMIDFLVETEAFLPDVFKAMRTGGDAQVIQEAWHYMFSVYMKRGQKPIPKANLIHFLQERTPVHSIDRIVQVMIDAKFFKVVEVNKVGQCLIPSSIQED